MSQEIRVLDVVALIEDIPDRGLLRGQVGLWWNRLVPVYLRWSS